MENASYISLSRQVAIRRKVDMIANNIANMNTTGYKGEQMVFSEYLKPTASGQRVSLVQDIVTVRDVTQGNKVPTFNDLDLAIVGQGYFAVETPFGERYTRNGSLSLNPDSQLVTAAGHPILGDNDRPIVIAGGGPVEITENGTVSGANGAVGRIKVVTFEDEQAMVKLSGSLYDADGQDPEPSSDYKIQQGMLESSNINAIVELTRMLETTKSNSNVVKMSKEEHERIMKAIRILGSTSGI